LVGPRRQQLVADKESQVRHVIQRLEQTRVGEVSAAKYFRRPEVRWAELVARLAELADVHPLVAEQVECDIKYAGYIARQEVEIARHRRLAHKRIPADLDYAGVRQLRTEAREKLSRIRPTSLDQASRISGITPADLALLMTHLQAHKPDA
jgi:tRNA uridine 5-carboxymethylaminomethyl modification enzyme